MSFLRPQALAHLQRWQEVAAAALLAALGLWALVLRGYFFVPLGLVLVALALGWAVIALRRLRFQRPVTEPGLVEVDEGQVGYLGPDVGGYVALRDLAEVRLIRIHGQPLWRLKQSDGQALLIPHQAAGAAALFDAFASLPGADMAAFAGALDQPADTQTLWVRAPRSLPVRP